jgi:hypothetical protein
MMTTWDHRSLPLTGRRETNSRGDGGGRNTEGRGWELIDGFFILLVLIDTTSSYSAFLLPVWARNPHQPRNAMAHEPHFIKRAAGSSLIVHIQ